MKSAKAFRHKNKAEAKLDRAFLSDQRKAALI